MSDKISVICGGSWYDSAEPCRSAYRGRDFPSDRGYNFGFRVVKETEPKYRVSRGGSWYYTAEGCRSAYRNRNNPSYRRHNYGFRVVKGETNE